VKVGKYHIGRDGIGRMNVVWRQEPKLDADRVMTIGLGALRPFPPVHSKSIAVTPRAYAEDPAILAEAFRRLIRNAVDTHKALQKKGSGLRLETLSVHYVKPEPHEPSCDLSTCPEEHISSMNHLVSWKAYAR
jgi:hypothetical protein